MKEAVIDDDLVHTKFDFVHGRYRAVLVVWNRLVNTRVDQLLKREVIFSLLEAQLHSVSLIFFCCHNCVLRDIIENLSFHETGDFVTCLATTSYALLDGQMNGLEVFGEPVALNLNFGAVSKAQRVRIIFCCLL